jgi:hypothetical protein
MIHTSSECVQMGCLEDVYQLKKESKIIEHCHSSPYGGNYGAFRTHAKI